MGKREREREREERKERHFNKVVIGLEQDILPK